MSIILQWFQLVLKLHQQQPDETDSQRSLEVQQDRLSVRDKTNLFIAAHRRFIL